MTSLYNNDEQTENANSMTELFGEVISSYSRAQAIEDGVLVDVSETAREAGFRFPVAVTRRLFDEVITPDPRSEKNGQSVAGRLWDTLNMLRFAIRGSRGGQVILYKVIFIMKANQRRTLTLKSACGPGDNLEPTITIMMPDED